MENAEPGEAYENETQRNIIGRNGAEEGNDILGKFNPGLGAQSFDQKAVGQVRAQGIGSCIRVALHDHGASRRPMCPRSGWCWRKNPPQTRYFFHAGPTASNLAIPPGDGNAEVVSELTLAQEPSWCTRSRTCIFAARISNCG